MVKGDCCHVLQARRLADLQPDNGKAESSLATDAGMRSSLVILLTNLLRTMLNSLAVLLPPCCTQ